MSVTPLHPDDPDGSPEGARPTGRGYWFTPLPVYLLDAVYDGDNPVNAPAAMLWAHIHRHYAWRERIFPSCATLAEETGQGERTVQRLLQALKEAGAITWGATFSSRGRSSNEYALAPVKPFEFDRAPSPAVAAKDGGHSEAPAKTGGHRTAKSGGNPYAKNGGGIQSTVDLENTGEDAAPDARRATAGSSVREAGGCAASGKTSAPRLNRHQHAQVDAVWQLLPAELAGAVPRHAHGLDTAILEALAVGEPFERTAQQLVDHRVLPRWNGHWAAEHFAGRITSPVGALRAMLARSPLCNDPRCDEHTEVDTGQPCRSCAGVREDRRADRTAPPTAQAGPVAADETYAPPPFQPEPDRPAVPPNEAIRQARAAARARKGDVHRQLNRTANR